LLRCAPGVEWNILLDFFNEGVRILQVRVRKAIKIVNPAEINAPIITHTFAVDKGRYGYIWKIYIKAEDPDGDMERIAVVVDQMGYGHYPTEWIFLRPQYRAHLTGYLQWNTFSSKTSNLPDWTQITVKVSIFDKAGNESNQVLFPFTFESGSINQKYQLPAPFDKENIPRLGNIMIDLYHLPY